MMEKPLYRTYSSYLKEKYGEKVYKLPVNLPVSCPNRTDGRGCTFCADIGTGFESDSSGVPLEKQMERAAEIAGRRYKARKFIAYFQNYTNTFLPLGRLSEYMERAAKMEGVVELCISTRPDCIREDYLEFFDRFREEHQIEITVELGLQTVNYHTLQLINRGHGLAELIDAVLRLERYRIPVCVHMILNLPGDTMADCEEAARILSALPVTMVKLHSLYIPKHSTMADQYERGELSLCSKEEYLERLSGFIALLRQDIVVERLFSRIPEADAVFCNWNHSWWKLANEWEELMRRKGYTQGARCNYLNGAALNRWEL